MADVSEEFKRLEEKQKIANFEIEKRFAKLEDIMDSLQNRSPKANNGSFSKDLQELRNSFNDLRKTIEAKIESIETIHLQLLGLEKQGKFVQIDTAMANFDFQFKSTQTIIEDMQRKINFLEKEMETLRSDRPIVLE